MSKTTRSTVFRSGNSDAVRLPKGFRIAGKHVRLRQLKDGRLIVEPLRPSRWPKGFLASFGKVTDDFAAPGRPIAVAIDEARAANRFRRRD